MRNTVEPEVYRIRYIFIFLGAVAAAFGVAVVVWVQISVQRIGSQAQAQWLSGYRLSRFQLAASQLSGAVTMTALEAERSKAAVSLDQYAVEISSIDAQLSLNDSSINQTAL